MLPEVSTGCGSLLPRCFLRLALSEAATSRATVGGCATQCGKALGSSPSGEPARGAALPNQAFDYPPLSLFQPISDNLR